jgi:hypothetical protein
MSPGTESYSAVAGQAREATEKSVERGGLIGELAGAAWVDGGIGSFLSNSGCEPVRYLRATVPSRKKAAGRAGAT